MNCGAYKSKGKLMKREAQENIMNIIFAQV